MFESLTLMLCILLQRFAQCATGKIRRENENRMRRPFHTPTNLKIHARH
jgi:hypothetical protein